MIKKNELELNNKIYQCLYQQNGVYALMIKNEKGIYEGILYNGILKTQKKWF